MPTVISVKTTGMRLTIAVPHSREAVPGVTR
jgi:hypothetical protein